MLKFIRLLRAARIGVKASVAYSNKQIDIDQKVAELNRARAVMRKPALTKEEMLEDRMI